VMAKCKGAMKTLLNRELGKMCRQCPYRKGWERALKALARIRMMVVRGIGK